MSKRKAQAKGAGPFQGLRTTFRVGGCTFELRVDRLGLLEPGFFAVESDGDRARLTVRPDATPGTGHAGLLSLLVQALDTDGLWLGRHENFVRALAPRLLIALHEAGAWQGLSRLEAYGAHEWLGRPAAREVSGFGGCWYPGEESSD